MEKMSLAAKSKFGDECRDLSENPLMTSDICKVEVGRVPPGKSDCQAGAVGASCKRYGEKIIRRI